MESMMTLNPETKISFRVFNHDKRTTVQIKLDNGGVNAIYLHVGAGAFEQLLQLQNVCETAWSATMEKVSK